MQACLLLAALLIQQSQAPPRTTVTLSTDSDFRFESDLDGTEASGTLEHFKLSLDVFRMAGPTDFLRISGAGEFFEYDFSDLDTVLPGATEEFAEEVHAYRLDPSYIHVFDATWSGVIYGTASWAYEEEGNVGDSTAGAIGVGAFYRMDADLTLGLSVRYQSRIEDHEWVYPLPYIDWKLAPGVTLKTEQKAGYGLTFDHALDEAEAWVFEARVRYQGRRIRLRSENVLSQGILDDQRGMIDAGIRWEPSRGLRIQLYAGVDVWQQYTFEDRTGSNLMELESEMPVFAGLAAGWEF